MRIYITGASGTGTSSLALTLANKLQISHLESDDLFWENTDPPFTTPRKSDALHELFKAKTSNESFILSGDVLNWGLPEKDLLQLFTHVIFLYVPWNIREKRIREREAARFKERILPNGDMYETHESFIKWASLYEQSEDHGRNLKSQKSFYKKFIGKKLSYESPLSLDELTQLSLSFLKN